MEAQFRYSLVGAPSLQGGAGDTKSKGHSWRAGLDWDVCPRRVDAQRRDVPLGHPNSVASAATHWPLEGRSRPALTPTTTHTHTHTAVHSWIVPSEPGVPPHSQKGHPTPDLRKHHGSVPPPAGLGENSPEESALVLKMTATPAPNFPLSCGSHHWTLVTVQVQTLWLGRTFWLFRTWFQSPFPI